MIRLNHKYDCCGCSACVQRCPKQCISMSEDEEGFLYPHIDTSTCIDCGLCEKVCPVINQAEPRQPKECYAAYNLDENVRRESSSGGVFSLLAEKVIREGGIVFGATWNDRWQVVHTYTVNIEGLAQFRGSKYIQSIVGESYKQAERFLKDGRKVLFSGTPCQIAGLRLFLRKDYENLVTVDFICHGVPSPGVFRWYLQEELNDIAHQGNKNSVSLPTIHSIPKGDVHYPDGLELRGIRFRDKCTGWKKFSFALDLAKATAGGEEIQFSLSKDLGENTFLKGFLSDLYLRPSCHNCPAKSFKSGSDITIADYWGYEDTAELKDDDKGISAVLINTNKGDAEYKSIDLLSIPTTIEKIRKTNGAINHSSDYHYREYFFWHKGMPLQKIVDRITSDKFFDKVCRKLFRTIRKPRLK